MLILQIIPLVLFPPDTYNLQSQEWWLPVLLTVFTVWAVVELTIRRNKMPWPWYLINFAQGFSLISRLLMVFPHMTVNVEGQQVFNYLYVILAAISMTWSFFMIGYSERTDVRMAMLRD